MNTRDQWVEAVSECAHSLRVQGLAESTVSRISRHVRRFGAMADVAPFAVTSATIADWLQGPGLSRQARYAYGTSLRTFYRWAYSAGRIDHNPTETHRHALALATPPGWVASVLGFRRWLAAGGRTDATVRTWSAVIARLARQTGIESPAEVSPADVASWLASHPDWKRDTLRTHRSAVRVFFAWALEAGVVHVDPAAALPKVRAATPSPRPASEDAYRSALAASPARTRLILRLAGDYGLRRNEIAQIHTRDLALDALGCWWLHVHGKGDKVRRVPLAPHTVAVLQAHGAGYVFPGNQDGHLSAGTVGKLAGDALPDGVTLHQLRHRFATRAYALNSDVLTLQRLLGHSSPATTQRYVQTPDDTLRAMVAAVGALTESA